MEIENLITCLIVCLLNSATLAKPPQTQGDIGAYCVYGFQYECWDDITQNVCEEKLFGEFLGALSTCDVEGSFYNSVYGACCVENYTKCWGDVTEEECGSCGGKFLGEGSTCANEGSWCTIYYGACCYGTWCEEFVAENVCEISGGIFWFDTCDQLNDVPECGSSYGACCIELSKGMYCEEGMQNSECEANGGFFYGIGSTCDDEGIECTNGLYGACCLGDTCETLYDFDCKFSGGIWYEGECTNQFCVECDSDIDQDGQTNVNDLLAIIAAWGIDCDGCSEDVNNDANVNVADLLIVIGNWGPCE